MTNGHPTPDASDDDKGSSFIDLLRRLLGKLPSRPGTAPEKLTAERIDAGYRLFWTKMAITWDDERRQAIAARLTEVFSQPDFENNALERRYRVEGLDDQAHSGASLLMLAEVISALDKYESADDNS